MKLGLRVNNMKVSYSIIFPFLFAFMSCSESSLEVFMKEDMTCETCTEEFNILIHNDLIYENLNSLTFKSNFLYKRKLTFEEKDSLQLLIEKIKNPDSLYGGSMQSYYKYYLDFLVKKEDSYMSFKVLDDDFPNENIQEFYKYIHKISSKGDYKKYGGKYNGLEILNIVDKNNEKVKYKTRNSFVIWSNLLLSEEDSFLKIDKKPNYLYKVIFTYSLNSKYNHIDEVYLDQNNKLFIKFKNSSDYYVPKKMEFP